MGKHRNNIVGGDEVKETAGMATPSQSKVVQLIKRTINGDCEAFGELYSMYLDRIYRYVFYQVKDKMTAEDITEEVFIKAWNAIGSCKGREKTFSAWLYRIAHNRMVDIFRSQEKERPVEIDTVAEVVSAGREVETDMEHRELLDSIAQLPPNQKQVIILKYIEGLDNPEIERITGKKQGAIRVLQMRALTTLRERLIGES
ncbi:RNA polymerase sigma factor [Chloroflexota bacterium]